MWADERRVNFTVLELKKNDDLETVDAPALSFREVGKVASKRNFCDVNEAMTAEAARLFK
ncbi:hypothetical protein ACN9MZ_09360 [Pseudoduganella sp. S-14]|jgi:hypothetical protein|uniref:hypothetical protein n=1 Tax=Pseudoduganella sp. S-14 TaxID=3404065 RepID=UPI003CF6F6F5